MEGFACTVCSLRSWIVASSACRRAASARSKLNRSDIPTFHYTAHLADVRWLRRAARRKSHG
ncbi:NinE family protein [Klebsiella variicola subsp. variicola]|nr:NinE family protein [Klebsiella variicola subsp. variicola]